MWIQSCQLNQVQPDIQIFNLDKGDGIAQCLIMCERPLAVTV